MHDVLTRADIEALRIKLDNNGLPPNVCAGCGRRFYRLIGAAAKVAAGVDPCLGRAYRCEDCSGGAS